MFQIIKYLHPTWYFNLRPGVDFGYFPKIDFDTSDADQLKVDYNFAEESRLFELAFRANRLGIISKVAEPGVNWWSTSKFSILDEYKFARKYFPQSRVTIALFLRILSLHNPLREIKAYVNSLGMKKMDLKNTTSFPTGFDTYIYKYLSDSPLITVVIPTLNRYKYLSNVLQDLEKQDYKNFEVIVVDQSQPFDKKFYENYNLKVKLIRQEEQALWLARNNAIKSAAGEWIALSEDDVRIPPDWLTNHLKCIEFFNADISNGVFFPSGKKLPPERNFFRYSDQFATGNAFLNKKVFLKTGLFDRQFEKQRMGDGEFGLRAYKSGFKSIMNPLAWCEDIKATTGGLRESGNWDAFRPKNIWSMRPVPSVLYFYRKYFGEKAAVFSLFINIPPSITPYRFKQNKKLLWLGALCSVLILPLIIFQIIRSWRRSTQMLKQNEIEMIHGQ